MRKAHVLAAVSLFACSALFAQKSPSECSADFNGDQRISTIDLLMILPAVGQEGNLPQDLDNDGVVGYSDVLIILGLIGTDCD